MNKTIASSSLLKSIIFLGSIALLVGSCQQSPDSATAEAKPLGILQQKQAELLKEYQEMGSVKKTSSLPDSINFEQVEINYPDIAPIFINNCIFCHKPEGNAPFPLTDYNYIKKKAQVIKKVIEKRIMPPWMPDNTYSHLFNAPEITDSSRVKLITWINRGCPNPGDKTIKMVDYEKELKTKPDLVLTQDKAHVINSNKDTYQCFIFDPELDEDKYLSGIDFVSDNPETVHHFMLYIDTNNVIDRTECWDCKGDGIVDKLIPIQVWSKGVRPYKLKGNLATRIKKGTRFILQTHYGNENNKGREEKTTLKLYFTEPPVNEVTFVVANKNDIFYPANVLRTETLAYPVKDSMSLFGIVPHAHFLAKKIECFALAPDSSIIQLLKIPYWDYLWQGQYVYERPVIIPAGSTIYLNVVIDNTANNPTQPNDPIRDVIFKSNSNDEMMVLVLQEKKYKKGDEDIEVAELLK